MPPGSVSLDNIHINSIKYKCARDWNDMLKTLSRTNISDRHHTQGLLDFSIPKLKRISKAHFIDAY